MTTTPVDVFDREARFIDAVLAPLVARHAALRKPPIVLEANPDVVLRTMASESALPEFGPPGSTLHDDAFGIDERVGGHRPVVPTALEEESGDYLDRSLFSFLYPLLKISHYKGC